jgi:hypothetical protein
VLHPGGLGRSPCPRDRRPPRADAPPRRDSCHRRERHAASANGQKYRFKGAPEPKTYSAPDASWGHRSAVSTRAADSFYGYKRCPRPSVAEAGLPLAWQVETAKAQESSYAVPLLDALTGRGFRAEVAVMDMGYDLGPVYEGFEVARLPPGHPAARDPAAKAGSSATDL